VTSQRRRGKLWRRRNNSIGTDRELAANNVSNLDDKSIVRHIRGATVTHRSPFSSLEVPCADDVFTESEYERWVDPFYRVSFRQVEPEFFDHLRRVYAEITPAIVERLLTDYNWRPRLTGAFFAALRRFTSAEDHIGRLLVRSDLCFAGKLYCVALAEFNTSVGLDYLTRYLQYYLTRPELDYDQGDAMGAIAYLDAKNGTNRLEIFRPLWETYASAKSWKPDLQKDISRLEEEIRAIHAFRAKIERIS
jgi:hypothetical protein